MTKADFDELKIEQFIGLLSGCASLQRADIRFVKHNFDIAASVRSL
jgi:hypothetical protein